LTITIESFGYDRLYTNSWDLVGGGPYVIPIEVVIDCTYIGWDDVEWNGSETLFTFWISETNYVYEVFALILDSDGIPWSEHLECGYTELTWTDVPSFCADNVPVITQNNGYDYYEGFYCLPYLVEHVGWWIMTVTRYLAATGASETKTVSVYVHKDCSDESYFVPENPADSGTTYSFMQYTPTDHYYYPTTETTSDADGVMWNSYAENISGYLCGET
jgi:hypothetical protein